MKRRSFIASFKAKVALAAAWGDRSTAELASKLGVHTSRVTARKKQLLSCVRELFADGLRRWIEPKHAVLSIAHQSELLRLARSTSYY